PTKDQRRNKALETLSRRRKEAAAEIERLLDFMDASDLDPDLEPDGDGDEQSDEPEDGGDDEDSLGSLERYASSYGPDGHNPTGSQLNWAGGRGDDLEDEHDGAEPDECGEPSLGSLDRVTNQEQSWYRENPLSVGMEEAGV